MHPNFTIEHDDHNKTHSLMISYGFHDCPFGKALLMKIADGLCGLAFADPGSEAQTFADMQERWPHATYQENTQGTAALCKDIFNLSKRPLKIIFMGSDFETTIWKALLHIPIGQTTTYAAIASTIGRPKASRAVGTAIGKNPLSFIVPCHRVLGKNGDLCGYHWGLARKQALLDWEHNSRAVGCNPERGVR